MTPFRPHPGRGSPTSSSRRSARGLRRGFVDAWCRAGLFELAFANLRCDAADTGRLLEAVDQRVAEGVRLDDASLIGAFFMSRFAAIVQEMTADGSRIDNVELLQRLQDLLDPTAAAMHLSNHTVHLLHQGLFTLTKLARSPERGRQVVKLSRQEYFEVAWGLHGLAAAVGLVDREVHVAWARALERVRQGGPVEEIVSDQVTTPQPRRRRRPRRGRRRR